MEKAYGVELILMQRIREPVRIFLNLPIRILAPSMLLRPHGRQLGYPRNNIWTRAQIVGPHIHLSKMFLALHQLNHLLSKTEGLFRLGLVPARGESLVVQPLEHLVYDSLPVQAQSCVSGALHCFENQVLHTSLIHPPHYLLKPLFVQTYTRIVEPLHHAHHILPVFRRLALLNDIFDSRPSVGPVAVAVNVFERERHVAESDFNGLCFESRAVLFFVYEVTLLFVEVFGEKGFGV